MAPPAVEEALSKMLEAQSLTLMIQIILGELAPEGETVEAQGAVEEEEGSSFMPGKKDMVDVGALVKFKLLIFQLSKSKFSLLNL